MNISLFRHLFIKVYLDCTVDHLALTYIIKSKAKPDTSRIKRLLEMLSSYSINFDYMKGKLVIFFPE